MSINELVNELKVPKSQYNSFGKYSFRNNEDIQTALKPLLLKYDVSLISASEIFALNNEIVVSIHLKLYKDEKLIASGDGHAVVDLNKKGMDKGQATGAAFSYASKYAFGQMLLIDDTKDNDGQAPQTTSKAKPKPKAAPKKFEMTMAELTAKVEAGEIDREAAKQMLREGKIDTTKK